MDATERSNPPAAVWVGSAWQQRGTVATIALQGTDATLTVKVPSGEYSHNYSVVVVPLSMAQSLTVGAAVTVTVEPAVPAGIRCGCDLPAGGHFDACPLSDRYQGLTFFGQPASVVAPTCRHDEAGEPCDQS